MYKELFFKIPEKIRYLFVGAYNTVFGFALFSLLYFLLKDQLHYLIILVLSTPIAIANSFLSLKLLVFRTQGNYLKEYLKCNISYSALLAMNAVILYILVDYAHLYIIASQLLCTIIMAITGYLVHKYFSFS
jgi:putative flippase GtrA